MTNGGLNAQTVGGHMADRKKMFRDQPRAIRNQKDDLERLRAVSDIRCRPWVGDKMLLMQANNTTHAKVKNHFEERARQEAKQAIKAGGQVLLDFEEVRDKRDTSSRYATKMWADYKHNKEEYLKSLRNGLISLKTGESIKGDLNMYMYSALNPANGHIQSAGSGNTAGKGVAKLAGGRDDLLRRSMEDTPNTIDKYSSTAEPCQHPTRKREPFRSSNDQAENSANKKSLEQTRGSIDSINSGMTFHNNPFGGGESSDGYFGKSPDFCNDRLGARIPSAVDQQFHQPKAHTKSMHIGSQPSNRVDQSSEIGGVSLGGNGWNDRQKEASIAYEGKSVKPLGSQADGFELAENSTQMAFAISSKKRKESLLEEETMERRPLKKQCQLEGPLQPEQQPEHDQLQPRIRYSGLDFEGNTGEGHVQELDHVPEEFAEWNRHVMQDSASLPVQPHIQGTSNRGEFGVSNNASYLESSLWIGFITNRENLPLNEENNLPGSKSENAIPVPDGKGDAETVRESQRIGGQTSFNGKQPLKEEDEPGYLAGASCVKGYTNAWYFQGRLRT
ncbi:hypothetical protein EYC80_006313 [Monilinia laxa]|nr:hypothetical protein EYC80_006313 [Monilinia laxa]